MHFHLSIVILFSSLGWCVQFWSSPLWDLHPGTTRSLQARRASCHGDKPRTSRSYSEMPAARCWCKTKNGRHHWWTRTINVRLVLKRSAFYQYLQSNRKRNIKIFYLKWPVQTSFFLAQCEYAIMYKTCFLRSWTFHQLNWNQIGLAQICMLLPSRDHSN